MLREAGLEVEWVDALAEDRTDDKAIATVVKAFHAFLDEPGDEEEGAAPRRGLLRKSGGDTALTKLVRNEADRLQDKGDAAS